MKILSTMFNRQNCGLAILGAALIAASAAEVRAQRDDPFRKPVVAAPKPKKTAAVAKVEKPKPAAPSAVPVPAIQARIDSYKAVRQRCIELGVACPKPTSVLTLDEMQVIGIFRTPRGPAAMVEATPIKLSYTIYPGEKFYDGQLVAVEEGKLTFRRTVQMTNGKEIVSIDNKTLRQATINDMSAARAENAAPMNPTVTAAPPGISAAAVLSSDQSSSSSSEAAVKTAAPAARVDSPAKPNAAREDDKNPIKFADDAEPAAPVKAVKKSAKTKNKR